MCPVRVQGALLDVLPRPGGQAGLREGNAEVRQAGSSCRAQQVHGPWGESWWVRGGGAGAAGAQPATGREEVKGPGGSH